MEYYVGLDVSLKQTSICMVNQTGSVVREGVVDSDPEAIAEFVRSNAPGVAKRNGLRKAKVAVARKLSVRTRTARAYREVPPNTA